MLTLLIWIPFIPGSGSSYAFEHGSGSTYMYCSSRTSIPNTNKNSYPDPNHFQNICNLYFLIYFLECLAEIEMCISWKPYIFFTIEDILSFIFLAQLNLNQFGLPYIMSVTFLMYSHASHRSKYILKLVGTPTFSLHIKAIV